MAEKPQWTASGTTKMTLDLKPASEPLIDMPPEGYLAYPIHRKRNKVAIIGFADSRDEAPYCDNEWDIWGLNSLWEQLPRWDLWFEIHDREIFAWHTNKEVGYGLTREGKPYAEGLSNIGVPVFMTKAYPEIPNSVAYPIDAMSKKYGACFTGPINADGFRYWTNTISMMMAIAIDYGYPEIGVWGVDMATHCLAPETKVLTSDLKWIPCGDIETGDELISFDEESSDGDGHSRRWRRTRVNAVNTVVKPCYEITLEDGTKFIASEKHGWLTHAENENRWKTTDQLITHAHRPGRPTRIIKAVNTWDDTPSWDKGYLAAAFDGEGHISQVSRGDYCSTYSLAIGYFQKENEMSETVERLLSKFRFNFTKNESDGTFKYTIMGGRPEMIRFLGQIRPPRLMAKFKPELLGQMISMENIAVEEIKPVGDKTVIGLETDTKTFIAEGFLSHNSEYGVQRPSCEFFIGVAAGLGRKIYLPATCDLLKTRFIYGFEEEKSNQFNAKMDKLSASMQGRFTAAQQSFELARKQMDQYIGAIECVKEIKKIWG